MPKKRPITDAMRKACFKYNKRLRVWRDTDMQIDGISEAEFIRRNKREIDKAIKDGECVPPRKRTEPLVALPVAVSLSHFIAIAGGPNGQQPN